MKVKKTKSGRVMLLATLGAMQVGETWKIDPGLYKVSSLRVVCSNYGSAVNKVFTVNAGETKTKITRTK